MFDISIHQYVVIDLATFGQIVDAIGGIDLYVERNMDYDDPEAGLSIHMRQGYRHLDGVGAEHYLRYRSDDLGDLGRTQRQQKFVKAFYAKLLRVDTLPKIPAIADILKHNVTTSAELFDSVHIGNVIRKLSIEPPRTIMLREISRGMMIPFGSWTARLRTKLFMNFSRRRRVQRTRRGRIDRAGKMPCDLQCGR